MASSDVTSEVRPTASPVTMVVTCGVRKRGCTRAKVWGSSPSRAMAKKIRGWPYWNTSSTADIDTIAPSATIHPTVVKPVLFSAFARGSATPTSSVYGTIPVSTAPTIM